MLVRPVMAFARANGRFFADPEFFSKSIIVVSGTIGAIGRLLAKQVGAFGPSQSNRPRITSCSKSGYHSVQPARSRPVWELSKNRHFHVLDFERGNQLAKPQCPAINL